MDFGHGDSVRRDGRGRIRPGLFEREKKAGTRERVAAVSLYGGRAWRIGRSIPDYSEVHGGFMNSSSEGNSGSAAEVGCVGEVVKHERFADDWFFLICKGQQRFRVARVVRTKPYLVAAVHWLEDRPPAKPPAHEEDAEALATDVEALMRDVIHITNRLNGKPEKEVEDLRRGLFLTPFSFYVGNTFEGAPREQQALLELEDTAARLRRERDTLRNTLNYLTTASAVKDAFPSSPSSG
ncbi:uncharacterized protein [Zea mays]|uniref:uncharacterized protein n=1 Tax=Zea mays TaxID=4577 RepID=UPI0004DE9D0C|nr:uncharacterized protein LOC103639888 [Zea mays]|eukprot:XP_008660795.1 uncharacterized protein LOC103639888 [Zea mays]